MRRGANVRGRHLLACAGKTLLGGTLLMCCSLEFLSGCGQGSAWKIPINPNPPSIEGAWTGTWSSPTGNGQLSAAFTQAGSDVGGTISFGPNLQLAIGCTVDGVVSATFVNNHRFDGSITDASQLSLNFSADVGALTITGTFTDTDPVSCLGASGQFTMIQAAAGTAISAENENRRTIYWWILDGGGEQPADERSGKIVLGRQ